MSDSVRRGAPRVDQANQCVWWGDERIELTPKAFLVLRCLMQRPNQLVTKNELLDAVWPDTHVMEGVLKVSIKQLRDALGDDAQLPRFIETVHRRGYRWVEKGGGSAEPITSRSSNPAAGASSAEVSAFAEALASEPALFVGRQPALDQLEQALARANRGARQLVFVTGDPGIGKTTLIDEFIRRSTSNGMVVARGQCVDAYGVGEAYMPLLEALEQICRATASPHTLTLFRRLAPSWVLQLPGVLTADESDELRGLLIGASSDRMPREMLRLLDELSAERTLVLSLEDLHWSDPATISLLAGIAARREPARLLVIASYRLADAIAALHPVNQLRHDLIAKRHASELALEGLTAEAVATYLQDRFGRHRLPAELGVSLHAHTGGNPLFLQNAIDEFVARGWLFEGNAGWECGVDLATLRGAVPATTREMIGFRLQPLAATDLELLQTASVIGASFATQALASALDGDPAAVETDCQRLAAALNFLDEGQAVRWPAGSGGMQHAFRHVLYQQVLYSRVTPARRELLHRRVAECLESGFGHEASVIAPQLALHFERGGDLRRAVHYRQQAAEQALGRYAYPSAIEHLRGGLEILRSLPANAERDAIELALQRFLLTPFYALFGGTSAEVAETIERIHVLSRDGGPMSVELFTALATLVAAQCTGGAMRSARSVSERLVEDTDDEMLATVAAGILGFCQLGQGEVEAGTVNLERPGALPEMLGPLDPATVAISDAALGRCLLGHFSRAQELRDTALQRAARSRHPATIVLVASGRIRDGVILLDDQLVETSTAILASLSTDVQSHWPLMEIAKGWLEIRRGAGPGADRVQQAREAIFASGQVGWQSFYAAMVATGLLRAGRHDEADSRLDEGLTLIRTSGECWCEAELRRLCGEVRLARARQESSQAEQLVGEAESCFRQALDVARSHGATWWELRAAVSLARLLAESDRRREARQLLRTVCGSFDEGRDLPDLSAAHELMSRV